MTTANASSTADNVHNIAEEAADKIHRAVHGGTGKKITWWGFAWRTASLVLLFVAAIVAVAFGMHFGIMYLGGLGLNATLTGLLQCLVAIAAYLASSFAAMKLSDKIGGFYADFTATKRAEAKS